MAIPVGFTMCTATLEVVGSSRVCQISMGVGGSGGISASTINAAWRNALIGSSASPFYDANMDTNWTLTETKSVKQLVGGALQVEVNTNPNSGVATKSTPSQNVSVLVNKRTPFGGRRYRGRLSAPPANIGEGSISRAGIIDGTELPIQQSYWDYVFTFMTTAGAVPYLFHYPTTLEDGGDFPPDPTPLSSLVVSALVGTNGSRLR